MKVKNILESKKRRGQILQVRAEDCVTMAIAVMVENDTGSVAVFSGGRFLGMLTFREVLAIIHEKGFGQSEKVPCGDILDNIHNCCATPEDSVDQIRNIMTNHHIRYLPVIQDGDLTDVVSFYDVARSVAKAADFENKMLKEYIGDWPSSPDKEEEEDDGGESKPG